MILLRIVFWVISIFAMPNLIGSSAIRIAAIVIPVCVPDFYSFFASFTMADAHPGELFTFYYQIHFHLPYCDHYLNLIFRFIRISLKFWKLP